MKEVWACRELLVVQAQDLARVFAKDWWRNETIGLELSLARI